MQVLENKAAKIILDQHPRYSSTEALYRRTQMDNADNEKTTDARLSTNV